MLYRNLGGCLWLDGVYWTFFFDCFACLAFFSFCMFIKVERNQSCIKNEILTPSVKAKSEAWLDFQQYAFDSELTPVFL